MTQEWKDKVVLFNGSITTLGAVIADVLINEGIKHLTILDVDEKSGTDLEMEITAKYGPKKLKYIKCDVNDEAQIFSGFEEAVKDQGYIDVVINYAAMMSDSKDLYRKMINLNFTSLVTSTLKSIDIMSKEREGGRGGTVINFSSVAALIQSHLLPIYFATKSSILQFTNCIGREEYYSRTGVKAVTLCLGSYDSPLLHLETPKSFDKHVEASLPQAFYQLPQQSLQSAAQGLADVFKLAESGSTWIVTSDRPAKDITTTINKAFSLTAAHVFE